MKLSIKQLSHLFKKYGDNLEIEYFNDVMIKGTCFLSTDIVLADHLYRLSKNHINEIEVYYNSDLYLYLAKEFPAAFRKPYSRLSFTEMDRHLEILDNVSAHSKRKRFIFNIGDIYGIDKNSGNRIIVIHHNELLDYKKWNNIKRNVDKDSIFLFRSCEFKIIIFVDLTMKTESGYIERFKINTDLISLMVSKKAGAKDFISPDFVPTEDVVSVTEPRLLLEEYIRTNARLIIIGEKLNDSYKKALLDVKKYDKYVRMIVVPSLDHKNLDDFFRQVKLVYNNNRWVE